MHSFYIAIVYVIFIVTSIAAPTGPQVQPEDPEVQPGDVVRSKPKNFVPRPPGSGSIGMHPLVVLSAANSAGYVQVAILSHSHPKSRFTKPASTYGLPIDPKRGESTVDVGKPHLIRKSHLNTALKVSITPLQLQALRTEIAKNAPGTLRPRDTNPFNRRDMQIEPPAEKANAEKKYEVYKPQL